MSTLAFYRITVKGHVDLNWSDWFDGLTISHDAERNETILAGTIRDQAALLGVISKVRDLGLALVSLNRIDDQNLWEDNMQ